MLARQVWLLVLGYAALALGRGMLLPFATLYFHGERGFPLAIVALGPAIAAPLGSLTGLAWGRLADHWGRKPVMAIGLAGQALATGALAWVSTPPEYLMVLLGNSIAGAAWGPAARAMIADLTTPSQRVRAFGLLYLATNVAMTVGFVAGGLLSRVVSFDTFFLADAAGATCLLGIVVALFVETGASTRAAALPEPGTLTSPLRDRRFAMFCAAALLAGLGWGQFEFSYAPLLEGVLGASSTTIGGLFAINTVLVVVCQVAVSRAVSTWSYARALRWAHGLLGLSLAVMWLAAAKGVGHGSQALVGISIALMTLGEVIFAPLTPALVTTLAGNRGFATYLATYDIAWSLALGAGAVIAGAFMDHGHHVALWPTIIAATAAAAWLFSRVEARRTDGRSLQGMP